MQVSDTRGGCGNDLLKCCECGDDSCGTKHGQDYKSMFGLSLNVLRIVKLKISFHSFPHLLAGRLDSQADTF
jgi:hypothetical protein